jgi:hypothetical protein
VGGLAAGAGNVISGNTLSGIELLGQAYSNSILNNGIGVVNGPTPGTLAPLGNGLHDVVLSVPVPDLSNGHNDIGGMVNDPAAATGNTIAANHGDGIFVNTAAFTTIRNNVIGLPDPTGPLRQPPRRRERQLCHEHHRGRRQRDQP